MARKAAQIFVASLPHPGLVRLRVEYDGKEGHIEVPVAEPQYDREPSVHAYRRELLEMLSAIDEWVGSSEDIAWPHARKT
jgi:hypothetical protein